LADAVQDDLGASIVEFDRTVDFDDLAYESANVANVFEIGCEDYHREWAGGLLGAEIDEVDSPGAGFHVQDFSCDAFSFADVLPGFAYGEAIGGEGRGCG
jgi:hypothetical protein